MSFLKTSYPYLSTLQFLFSLKTSHLKVGPWLFLLFIGVSFVLGACSSRTSSNVSSTTGVVDICVNEELPDNASWKDFLEETPVDSDADGEAGGEEGSGDEGSEQADAKCQWECDDGFEKYGELCYTKSQACDIVVAEISVGKGIQDYQSGTMGEYDNCSQVISCTGGYDNESGESTTCTKTAAGYYSPANEKSRTACPDDKKPTNNSKWSSETGLTSADNCAGAWVCETGYKANEENTDCLDGIQTFNVKGLVSKPDSTGEKGSKSRDLVLEIVAKDVTKWFVTHDGSLAPVDTTDTSSIIWVTGNPTGDQNYSLPEGVIEGAVALFLWVAYADGSLKSKTSGLFTLDVTAPTLSSVAVPTDPTKLVVGELSAPFNLNVSDVDAYSKYEYCFGQNCNSFNTIASVSDLTAIPLSFMGLSPGTNYVTFRVSDWVGNISSSLSQPFPLTCEAGYDNTQDENVCAETAAGFYSPAGSNARIACSIPSSATADDISTGLTSPSECFTCNVLGYMPSGNICIKESIAVAAGERHTCVLFSDKTVKCWGDNSRAQTGGGTQNAGNALTLSGTVGNPLATSEKATAIVARRYFTCALLDSGAVKCWGDNSSGQTGGGTQNAGNALTLSGTLGSPLSNGEAATALAAGTSHVCAILDDDEDASNGGPVKCWGSNASSKAGGGTPALGTDSKTSIAYTATAIAAGSVHTCAILSNNKVKCWGYNYYGQTGGGTQNAKNTLTLNGTLGSPLSNSETATALAAGQYHTCVILSDKSVKCWGSNSSGQTGGGTPLSAGETATAIAAGESHTCAILLDKSVKCWGKNSSGEIGDGTPLSVGETATAIVAGVYHNCAILSDKSVKCWGSNGFKRVNGNIGPESIQLGQNTKPTPTQFDIVKGFGGHTCIILSDNSVQCWGANGYGQSGGEIPSGIGTRTFSGTVGSPLVQGESAIALAAGYNHTCSILNDGAVKCWGVNSSGQAGGGTQNDSNTRVISETAGSPLASNETATAIATEVFPYLCYLIGQVGEVLGEEFFWSGRWRYSIQ